MASRGGRSSRGRRTWFQRAVLSVGIAITLVMLVAAGGVAWFGVQLSQLRRVDVALSVPAPGAPENYLIVGSDSRASVSASDPNSAAFLSGESTTRPGLSDSIMIMRVDPKTQAVALLSLPRDLWVPIASTGSSAKINSAFSKGPQTLVDTIQSDFGIPINHYLEVDFAGFQKLVNAIGGISSYFDVAMRDTNSGVNVPTEGCVKLDGAAALALARSRHLEYRDGNGRWVSDGANDFGRIQRQQYLIRKAAQKVEGQGLITDPVELSNLANVATSSVGLDRGLDIGHLVTLAKQLRGFNADSLVSLTVPVTRYNPAPDGSDAQKLIEDQAVAVFAAFGAPPSTTVTTPGSGPSVASAQTGHTAVSTIDPVADNTQGRLPLDGPPDGTTCD